MNIQNYFVDATALSKSLCQQPILCQLMYCGNDNFLGRPVHGYRKEAEQICLLTTKAAHALCQAQNIFLNDYGLSIKVYDAYRPLKAVADFVEWSKQGIKSEHESRCKEKYFPHLTKQQLFEQGYIASPVSRHCFGRAVDMVLYSIKEQEELNFGACVDFFGDISHTTNTANDIGDEAFQNRKIMQTVMQNVGFELYPQEFWHFEYYIQEIDVPGEFDIN